MKQKGGVEGSEVEWSEVEGWGWSGVKQKGGVEGSEVEWSEVEGWGRVE